PRIRPRLTRRLFLVVSAGKGTRGLLACSLPNRNPIMMAVLAWQTEIRGLRAGSLVPSYKPARLQAGEVLRGRRVLRARVVRPRVIRPCVARCGHAGEFEDGVSPPPGVSDSLAVPPFEVTRRCTMARPSPVPFGFE